MVNCELQKEGTARVCKLAIRNPGSQSSPPSALSLLGSNLLFMASWHGHSNLVLYSFQHHEQAHMDHADALPASHGAAGALAASASATPAADQAADGIEDSKEAGNALQDDDAADVAQQQSHQAAAAAAESLTAVSSGTPAPLAPPATQQQQQPPPGLGGLSSLVVQMELPGSTDGIARHASADGAPLQRSNDGSVAYSEATEPVSPTIDPLSPQPSKASQPGDVALASNKRPLSALHGQAGNGVDGHVGSAERRADIHSNANGDSSVADLTPAFKRAKADNGAAEAAPELPKLGSSILPGLPFAGVVAPPALSGFGSVIPGIGPRVLAPRVEEAEPMAEDEGAAFDDHDDLEEALYRCARTPSALSRMRSKIE